MATAEPTNRNTAPAPGCPICGRPVTTDYRPFCSRRCADVDLSRWIRGGYAIAGRVEDDEDGDADIQQESTAKPVGEPE